jgi:hypothetical protein
MSREPLGLSRPLVYSPPAWPFVVRADNRPGYVLMFMQTLHGQVYSRVSLLFRVMNETEQIVGTILDRRSCSCKLLFRYRYVHSFFLSTIHINYLQILRSLTRLRDSLPFDQHLTFSHASSTLSSHPSIPLYPSPNGQFPLNERPSAYLARS